MGGYDCTETEVERIQMGEKDYADEEWRTCPDCKGAGIDYCDTCHNLGEVPKNRPWPEDLIHE